MKRKASPKRVENQGKKKDIFDELYENKKDDKAFGLDAGAYGKLWLKIHKNHKF